jgi:hypothetical protein
MVHLKNSILFRAALRSLLGRKDIRAVAEMAPARRSENSQQG